MTTQNSNRTILITGASSGIGLEFARLLAQEGYDLVLVARDLKKLNQCKIELLERNNIQVTTLSSDLSQPNAAGVLWQELQTRKITIDTLINNAGFGDFGEFADSDWLKTQSMLELNIVALTHLTRLLIPGMIARKRGEIINVASLASFIPGPLMAVYYATKAYVLSFSIALANELEPQGILVMALCPGATATNFSQAANLGASKLFADKDLMSASEVARIGYQGLLERKVLVVPGFRNSFLALFSRLVPRVWAAKIGRRIQERKT